MTSAIIAGSGHTEGLDRFEFNVPGNQTAIAKIKAENFEKFKSLFADLAAGRLLEQTRPSHSPSTPKNRCQHANYMSPSRYSRLHLHLT